MNPLVTYQVQWFKVFRPLVIVAACSFAAWLLYPTIAFYSADAAKRETIIRENPGALKKILNLGLDLQGGICLVLDLDRPRTTASEDNDAIDRVYTVMENRINALGVAEPIIQKQGTGRLIVEMPGLRDPKIARDVVGATARLEFKLLESDERLERAIAVIDEVLTKGAAAPQGDTVAAKDSAATRQVAAQEIFAGAENADTTPSAPTGGFYDIVDQCETDDTPVRELLAREDIRSALAEHGFGQSRFLWGYAAGEQGSSGIRFEPYLVRDRVMLYGDAVADARAAVSSNPGSAGQWQVLLSLTGKGASQFSRITGMNIGKQLAIILDDRVYSAPVIREKIPGGRAEISGDFTPEEAKAISAVIRAGALPVPVTIVEERIVGPSLGQDSIRFGIRAGIMGMLAIFIYMIWYYRMSGFYADIALMLNLVFVVAVMSAINATLTLPGIAGLVLNLGMAVDANILVCERIREELRSGKTVQSSIAAGYHRAMLTIMDSNLTTLITAAILWWIGTGPVKGFAITLGIGIVMSLFTSLFITRELYTWFTRNNATSLSI